MPPEFEENLSFKVDTWSIGCIIYEMFQSEHPFQKHFSHATKLRKAKERGEF